MRAQNQLILCIQGKYSAHGTAAVNLQALSGAELLCVQKEKNRPGDIHGFANPLQWQHFLMHCLLV